MSVPCSLKWNSFHVTKEKLDYLHLKDFFNKGSYLKEPLSLSQRKNIAAYHSTDHTVVFKTIPIPISYINATFALAM